MLYIIRHIAEGTQFNSKVHQNDMYIICGMSSCLSVVIKRLPEWANLLILYLCQVGQELGVAETGWRSVFPVPL